MEPKGPKYASWVSQKEKKREKGAEGLIEEIMAENFSTLMTNMIGNTQEDPHQDILFSKFPNTNTKRILKAAREASHHI